MSHVESFVGLYRICGVHSFGTYDAKEKAIAVGL